MPAETSKPPGPRDRRNADLARIHVARRRLGLDEETYRTVLKGLAGVTSAADLDARGRARVLAAFREWGGLPGRGARPETPPSPERIVRLASRPAHVGKLRALWRRMHAAGIVHDPGPEALDHFIRHRTGVADARHLTGEQAARVVAALRAWWRRERRRRRPRSRRTARKDRD
jgi:phage gp16-like protein